MPQITAIVATYNRQQYLAEAIAALEAQDRPLDHIVIWDDGSTDGTETFARRLEAGSGGRVRYRRSANGGKSRALNAALAETAGDFVWICDDDDIALPHAAATLEAALTGSRAGLAAGRHDRFRDDPVSGRREMLGTGYWPDLTRGSILRHILEDVFFFQNATLVRREALERVGPFREDLARSIDYEMFVRLAARYPVAICDDILFHQRKHDGARGPRGARHTAAASEAVWLENDRLIFSGFREILPLDLYAAMFDGPNEGLRRRAGLLQRGTVHARRVDWDAAVEDFESAADLCPGTPLTATERAVVIRAMSGKHGTGGAFAAPHGPRLLALRARSVAGRGIAAALGRGAVWRVRESAARGAVGEAARAALFVARAGSQPARDTPIALHERTHLREADYDW
ncbi:hypothetical protein OCH239_12985 [Roseivivax halodurans JCM 10272]|uniref:Glycosyltransferase 2-like domain-containing protein n=1 Tax=Roseivivax halodurans JCM 10272 TaxID=1449350 RepID=X7EAR4_9RHOB|nr:glycosyltransferase family 2 protein [Roseivivax halodurans]ETX13179.1 hypothetical protein OCH239_12985 [Roseivivax halodurans JCM 10272]